MKKNTTIFVILVLAVIVVVCAFYFGVISKNSTAQLTGTGVDVAQACANQASANFNNYLGSSPHPSTESFTYTNHFNQSLGKCFMVITDLYTPAKGGMTTPTAKFLFDVYENKQLAFDNLNGPTPFCTIAGGGDCTIIPIFSNDMESTNY